MSLKIRKVYWHSLKGYYSILSSKQSLTIPFWFSTILFVFWELANHYAIDWQPKFKLFFTWRWKCEWPHWTAPYLLEMLQSYLFFIHSLWILSPSFVIPTQKLLLSHDFRKSVFVSASGLEVGAFLSFAIKQMFLPVFIN